MRIGGRSCKTVWFEETARGAGELCLIDQTVLPHELRIARFRDYRDVANAIRTMVVRGAPAIGAAAAFGMALAAQQHADLEAAAAALRATRPTAQDLFAAIGRTLAAGAAGRSVLEEARAVADGYERACAAIGELGAPLIREGARVNTHCNAGWLATVDWGTATAPMYMAHRRGVRFFVFVDETRPRGQGSRLTAFELGEEGIAHAVIADNASGWLMARGEIDLVIVGADRIAANGDVANKIGTYSSAVVARENGIPFYVAAPVATIDARCPTGREIPIEERSADEVSCVSGEDVATGRPATVRIAPKSSPARNPAFDVTPARLVTAIITENGIFRPGEVLRALAP
jgi:S-methyl-5-thioribose-1-phosphate isomerase